MLLFCRAALKSRVAENKVVFPLYKEYNRRHPPMYALTSNSGIYHLLLAAGQTLCGRAVVPVTLDNPRTAAVLVKTTEKPANRTLCKHCLRRRLKDGELAIVKPAA